MSEFDNLPRTESSANVPYGPPFRQNRSSRPPYYAPRGHSRPDPHVQKALDYFGVPDLRDLLNRKHKEDQLRGNLPSDQQNFSRKPSRNLDQRPAYKDGRGQKPSGSRGRFKGLPEDSFIQNPPNIKVELQTATGERHYTLNHENLLPDIKHIPDHNEQNESGRGRRVSNRGVGNSERGNSISQRGRSSSFRGRGKFDMGRGKYSNANESEFTGQETNREPVRGSERGRGGRGRGSMRAKSSERFHPGQSEENGAYSNGGMRIRSKSVEAKDDAETKNIDVETDGRGRGGRRRVKNGRRGGRPKQERKNSNNEQVDSLSEDVGIRNKAIVDEESATSKAELSDKQIEEHDDELADATEDDSQQDDTAKEGVDNDQLEVEKENVLVDMKENLIITSNDSKQKKRTVRFEITEGNVDQPANSSKTVDQVEQSKLAADIEKLSLNSGE